MNEELKIRFTYHPPKGDQPYKYEQIRETAFQFALLICEYTGESRERSLAITKLDEVVMWTNAAIARRS